MVTIDRRFDMSSRSFLYESDSFGPPDRRAGSDIYGNIILCVMVTHVQVQIHANSYATKSSRRHLEPLCLLNRKVECILALESKCRRHNYGALSVCVLPRLCQPRKHQRGGKAAISQSMPLDLPALTVILKIVVARSVRVLVNQPECAFPVNSRHP